MSSNLSYIQSRVFSKFHSYPFGSTISAQSIKTGEIVRFLVYPDKFIVGVENGTYLVKPHIPEYDEPWDTVLITEEGHFYVTLDDFEKFYVLTEEPDYKNNFISRVISDDSSFYAFFPFPYNAFYGTVFDEKGGVTFTKIDTTLIFKPIRKVIGIDGKDIRIMDFTSDPLVLYFLDRYRNNNYLPGEALYSFTNIRNLT